MSMERVVLRDDAVCFACADIYGFRRCYIHLTVRKWSASVMKELREAWRSLATSLQNTGVTIYAHSRRFSADSRFPKFVAQFGFEEICVRNGYTVYAYKGFAHAAR